MVSNQQQVATNNYIDYAIVARFTDSVTGKPSVIIAGSASGGTTAAAQFIADPSDLAHPMRAAKAAGTNPTWRLFSRLRL